jgi:hypothetical protein
MLAELQEETRRQQSSSTTASSPYEAARQASTSSVPGRMRIGSYHPRVVFLDIDGVVHSPGCSESDLFRPECMRALCTIVSDMEGTAIVLSSTWRATKDQLASVNAKLREYGMSEVASCTPLAGWKTRSDEILKWLDEHQTVQNFVVLDDLDLSTPHGERFTRHQVRTDENECLTDEDARRAITILQRRVARQELPAPQAGRPVKFWLGEKG